MCGIGCTNVHSLPAFALLVARSLHADPGARPYIESCLSFPRSAMREGLTTARCRYPSSNQAQNGGRVLATSNAVTSTSRISMPRSGAWARLRHASIASQDSQRS
jgi:hypothetical protein